MMSEVMADLPAGHPGCLVAAYCYQDRLFDREVRDLYTSVARYPPRIAVDLDHLADMLSAIAEDGIVVSKVIKDKRALSQQLMLYREFIRQKQPSRGVSF
jgi:TetR/AcrR family transcriptional repressor of nem operon